MSDERIEKSKAPESGNPDVIYNVEDKPPVRQSIVYALQHILAMLAGNVTVPLLVISLVGLQSGEGIFLIQCALLVAGLATQMQVVGFKQVGSRLPIVMGTSNAFLSTVVAIVSQYGIPACLGAGLIGGLFETFLGCFLDKLKKIFNPLVSGIVVMTIGLTLIPTGMKQAAGSKTAAGLGAPINLLLSGLVILVIILCNRSRVKMIKSASILIGIVAGYIVAICMGQVDFSAVRDAGWFSIPTPLRYKLEFKWPAIVSMLFMFVATTVETVGDTAALTTIAKGRPPKPEESKGAILADGLGSVLASFFNAFPNTSYTQNIGVVNLTGVFSRSVVTLGAFILVGMSLFPKLSAIILCVPEPALGGATLVTFTMVFLSGLSLIRQEPLNNRNLLIMAVSLGVGVGFSLVPEVTQACLPQSVAVCLNNGIIPAAILAIVLDNFYPKEKKRQEDKA